MIPLLVFGVVAFGSAAAVLYLAWVGWRDFDEIDPLQENDDDPYQ